MAADAKTKLPDGRPPLNTADTLDRAPRLAGHLSAEGIANLDTDDALSRKGSSVSVTTNGSATIPTNTNHTSGYDYEEDLEDYDRQKPEMDAMVRAAAAAATPALFQNHNQKDHESYEEKTSRPKSIPVRLEKTDKRGKYMLRADDKEFATLLKDGIERQKTGGVDAPAKRGAVRDLVFTRRFSTFDRQNPQNYESPFFGFFTLFWLCMALMLVQIAAKNWRAHGSILGENEIFKLMFSKDVMLLGVTDGALCAGTSFGFILHKLIAQGWIDWGNSGYAIESVWQIAYLVGAIGFTFYREWPWTHTIFIVLHAFVFLMKQHSYTFYNGYLSQVNKRRDLLKRKLEELQQIDPIPATPHRNSFSRPNSPKENGSPVSPRGSEFTPTTSGLRQRRRGSLDKPSNGAPTNLTTDPEDIAAIAHSISSHEPLTEEQMTTFSSVIRDEIDVLSTELRGKCTVTRNHYPSNLTIANFAEWTCLPTLVYELEYPRQASTNWYYVAEKTAATFGTLLVMTILSQAYIYPPVAATVRMKEEGMTVAERWNEFPWIVSDILFPLLLEQLLTWYVIWECVLNVLAEVFRFADRGFYGAWWNAVSFDQYARDWNRPVHNFLLRHVYRSSISAFHLNKGTATFATFLLSAAVHEVVMFCLFKKVRGYLFTTQLLQVPLVALSRTKWLRGRTVLGNVVFWIGLFVGPSFLTCLYLVI